METLDCRGQAPRAAVGALIGRYNGLSPNGKMAVLVDHYAAGLQMGLVEAGVRHTAEQQPDGHWRLALTRGGSHSMTGTPGLHHLVAAADGTIFTCERTHRAARIDGGTREIAAVNAIAKGASHLALDPECKFLFVADAGGNALVALRTHDLSVVDRWDVPGSPQLPMITEDGIVCVTGSGAGALGIVWRSKDGFHHRNIEVGQAPHDPLGAPDGKAAYVPCAGDGTVVKVSLPDGTILGRYRVGEGPAHLAFHPDGSRLYVANTFDGTLTCISPGGDILSRAESGGWAHVPEVTPDGQHVYVANFRDDTLAVFDATTLDRLETLPTDAYPHGLNISPDGRYVVATGYSSDCARVYDAGAARERSRVSVGAGGSHTAFLPDGRTAVIGCSLSDHLAFIDMEAGKLTGTVSLQ